MQGISFLLAFQRGLHLHEFYAFSLCVLLDYDLD